MLRLDSHHHLWDYDPVEYAWIGDQPSPLRRSWLPADLAPLLAAGGIDATIAVEARQGAKETLWLLAQAAAHPWIVGVVGNVSLTDPALGDELDRVAAPKLVAVRGGWTSGEPALHDGLAAIEARGLAFDLLLGHANLSAACELVDAHPHLRFVVNHLAKPDILRVGPRPWADDLARLAQRPHVWCKLSGLATEADRQRWTDADLEPYMAAALEAFGPRRLMFGSDWPVCLRAVEYQRWVEVVERFAQRLTSDEQAWLWAGAAQAAYRLPRAVGELPAPTG